MLQRKLSRRLCRGLLGLMIYLREELPVTKRMKKKSLVLKLKRQNFGGKSAHRDWVKLHEGDSM